MPDPIARLQQQSVRLILVTFIAIALSGCHTAQQTPLLEKRLHQALHQLDSTGVIAGVRVVDPRDSKELYAERADESFIPASNMKLLATAAAVDRWDGDHSFKTYLAMEGDDLWLIGTGDPGVGDPRIAEKRGGTTVTVLDQWADALKAKGIMYIRGKLLYYDAAFESQQIHPTWHRTDLTAWYAAPIGGLNFNDNCVDITVFPTEPGQPVRYEVVPPVKNITVNNKCVTGASGAPDIQRESNANVYTLTGGCTAKTALRSRPVTDPGAFFADALRTHLQSKGIIIEGPTERATKTLGDHLEPPHEKIIATHHTRLDELLPRINKNSQNLLAEGLCKLLGSDYDQRRGINKPASWGSANEAVRAFLRKQKIDDSRLVYADGSGLSSLNRVTPKMISELLLVMHRHPKQKLFFDSLPVGGKDGTIDKRFTDMPGRVHAKTGYISGTRALSGYVKTDGGNLLIFSILYNKIQGSVKPIEHMQDQACRVLMSYPKLGYEPVATQPATTQSR
jgi:D-alanyl-D-alanine carboxypeptidase/D-alanyl-D-alanine-endopeptidase (penicillin-binding protein 4)